MGDLCRRHHCRRAHGSCVPAGDRSFQNLERDLFLFVNRPIGAEQVAAAIRGHWGIENRSHYVRDVTLCEDASRIRKNPGVFARIRSFAYNILRINQSDSIAQDRYAAALGRLDFLLSLKFYRER